MYWAMRGGDPLSVLLENRAHASVFCQEFPLPADVAAEGFEAADAVQPRKRETSNAFPNKNAEAARCKVPRSKVEEKCRVRANILFLSTHSRTLVLHHLECLEHIPK